MRERDNLEDLGVDWIIKLRWICRKWDVGAGLKQSGSRWGEVTGTCESGNES